MVEGAETLFFLGVLALGFRNSLFDRFWPLAIQFSDAETGCGPSCVRVHAQPQCVLPDQCCPHATSCNAFIIRVISTLPLDPESIGLELASYS